MEAPLGFCKCSSLPLTMVYAAFEDAKLCCGFHVLSPNDAFQPLRTNARLNALACATFDSRRNWCPKRIGRHRQPAAPNSMSGSESALVRGCGTTAGECADELRGKQEQLEIKSTTGSATLTAVKRSLKTRSATAIATTSFSVPAMLRVSADVFAITCISASTMQKIKHPTPNSLRMVERGLRGGKCTDRSQSGAAFTGT